MTLQELIDSTRSKIDDIRKSRFPEDTQIIAAANEANLYIYRKLIGAGIYTNTDSVTVSFVANTQETTIVDSSDDVVRNIQKAIHVKTDTDKTPIPVVPKAISLGSDQPTCYIVRESTSYRDEGYKELLRLGWYVVPTTSFDVILYYAKKLNKYLTTYDPISYVLSDIPEEWHDIVSAYMAVLLLGTDENNVSFWYGIFQNGLQEIIESGDVGTPTTGQVLDVSYVN